MNLFHVKCNYLLIYWKRLVLSRYGAFFNVSLFVVSRNSSTLNHYFEWSSNSWSPKTFLRNLSELYSNCYLYLLQWQMISLHVIDFQGTDRWMIFIKFLQRICILACFYCILVSTHFFYNNWKQMQKDSFTLCYWKISNTKY